jgi:hypothetical protein
MSALLNPLRERRFEDRSGSCDTSTVMSTGGAQLYER